MEASDDYYHLLQVHTLAGQEVIKASYRALMQKHHPDVGGCEFMAARLNEAYRVLSNPSLKAEYDHMRLAQSRGSRVSNDSKVADEVMTKSTAARNDTSPPAAGDQLYLAGNVKPPASHCAFCRYPRPVPSMTSYHTVEQFCQQCRSPLCINPGIPAQRQQRDSSRIECQKRCVLQLSTNPEVSHQVLIGDISATGLRIDFSRPLVEGSIARITNDEFLAVVEVARCSPQGASFRMGMQFLAISYRNCTGNFVSVMA